MASLCVVFESFPPTGGLEHGFLLGLANMSYFAPLFLSWCSDLAKTIISLVQGIGAVAVLLLDCEL